MWFIVSSSRLTSSEFLLIAFVDCLCDKVIDNPAIMPNKSGVHSFLLNSTVFKDFTAFVGRSKDWMLRQLTKSKKRYWCWCMWVMVILLILLRLCFDNLQGQVTPAWDSFQEESRLLPLYFLNQKMLT